MWSQCNHDTNSTSTVAPLLRSSGRPAYRYATPADVLSFGHVSQVDITTLRVAWPGGTSLGSTSFVSLYVQPQHHHFGPLCLCLFSSMCVHSNEHTVPGEVAHYVCHHEHTADGNAKSNASFSTTFSSNGSFTRAASFMPACGVCCCSHTVSVFVHVPGTQMVVIEVSAVGQWKPITCGEQTFVQSSVGDNKEFVFPGIAASEGQTGYMMCADAAKFALSLSVILVFVCGSPEETAVPVGWMVRRPVLKTHQFQCRERHRLLWSTKSLFFLRLLCTCNIMAIRHRSYICNTTFTSACEHCCLCVHFFWPSGVMWSLR